MTTSRRFLLPVLLVFAVVAASCASEPTAEERAAARQALLESTGGIDPATGETVLGPTATSPDTTADSGGGAASPSTTDCTGASCGSITSPPASADALTAAVSSAPQDARFALLASLELIATVAANCSDLVAWTASLDQASAIMSTAAEALNTTGGDWVGSPNAVLVADEVRDQLMFQRDCTDGAEAADEGAVSAAVAAIGRASGANDDLRLALTGDNPATGSEFWYHADQIGHTMEMARWAFADPIDVLIVGSSTSKRGIDPDLMTSGLGRSTMNAAVAGLFPTTMQPWTDTARQLAGDPATIVVGLSSFQDFLECSDSRRQKMDASVANQTKAFSPVPAVTAGSPSLQLVGGLSGTYESSVLAEYAPEPGSRGHVSSPDRPNPDSVTYYTQLYSPQMANAVYCPANAAAVNELLNELAADEREVLVVSLPLSPLMAELHPGGRTAHDEAIDAYERIANDTGAAWLDLTDLLGADEFLDLTHATSGGREKITAAVVQALQ